MFEKQTRLVKLALTRLCIFYFDMAAIHFLLDVVGHGLQSSRNRKMETRIRFSGNLGLNNCFER